MRPFTWLLASGLLLTSAASAQHWHDDEKHWNKHVRHEDDDDRDFDHRSEGCYFRPADTRVITQYYAPRYRELPPGLQKQYYRTGHLPPGWQRKMQPIPVVVERQLVPVPSGYRRGYIDGYAVVYSPRTQIVVDIVAVFGR